MDEGLAYLPARSRKDRTDGSGVPLKTESSCRAVALAPQTVTVCVLTTVGRAGVSESGIETQGWVFTDEIGRPYRRTA